MPSKRAVLRQFKRGELLAAVVRFGLEVRDRRVRDQLVDALAGSRKAQLTDVLGDMSRDQLKKICRALDLDDSGREKSVLIARLDVLRRARDVLRGSGHAISQSAKPPPQGLVEPRARFSRTYLMDAALSYHQHQKLLKERPTP
jgi:SAP domain-containing protein